MGNKKLITAIAILVITNLATISYSYAQITYLRDVNTEIQEEAIKYIKNLERTSITMTEAHNIMYGIKNEASKLIFVYTDDPRYQTEFNTIIGLGKDLEKVYEAKRRLEDERKQIISQFQYFEKKEMGNIESEVYIPLEIDEK